VTMRDWLGTKETPTLTSMTPEPSDLKNGPEGQQVTGTLTNSTVSALHATPCRGGGRATSSSTSQSRLQTESLKSYECVIHLPFCVSGNDTRLARATWPNPYQSIWRAPSNARQQI